MREMVISAEELGENLDIGYRKHDREDPKIMPEEFAADHVVPVRFITTALPPALVPLNGSEHASACNQSTSWRWASQLYEVELDAQGSAFDKPEAVLHGARQMAISEMAAEPEVRKFVRNKFMEKAVISTGQCRQLLCMLHRKVAWHLCSALCPLLEDCLLSLLVGMFRSDGSRGDYPGRLPSLWQSEAASRKAC